MTRIRHVRMITVGDGEFSACGLAEDAFSSGDAETDDEFVAASPGLIVTCLNCCDALKQWKEAARGLIKRPIKDAD